MSYGLGVMVVSPVQGHSLSLLYICWGMMIVGEGFGEPGHVREISVPSEFGYRSKTILLKIFFIFL